MAVKMYFVRGFVFFVALAIIGSAPLFAQSVATFEDETVAPATNVDGKLIRVANRTILAAGLPSVAASTKSLSIPAVVDEIADSAFDEFINLESVYLENGVKKIGAAAFSKCANLKDVYISESVESIADDAIPETASISGVSGSYAQKWASERKIAFQEFSPADLKKAFPATPDETPGAILFSRDKTEIEILRATGLKRLAGQVVIPEKIGGSAVVKLGDDAFADAPKMVAVVLPNGLKTIGARAFAGCRALTSAALPSSVETIGAGAFCRCYALKSLQLPTGIKTIENETFQGCVNLTSLKLSDQLTSIGVRAFYDCAALPALQLPENLKIIADAAFGHCYALSSLKLPDALETLGSRSFASNICLVVTPKSSAEAQAVKGNYKYATGVFEVDDDPGIRCVFWRETPKGIEINGVETTEKFDGTLTPPTTISNLPVVSVGDSAFVENTSLKEITLPPTVRTIGAAAFKGCSELASIRLSRDLRSIGKEAFADCQLLETPEFPDDMEWIGPKAFANCGQFDEIRLPYKLNLIGEEAFWSCDNLARVAFPYNLKVIGARAFAYCDKLKEVELLGGVVSVGPEAFPTTIRLKGLAGGAVEKWAKENNAHFEAF